MKVNIIITNIIKIGKNLSQTEIDLREKIWY